MTGTTTAEPVRLAAAAPAFAFAGAAVVLLGVANLPIGYYSIERWAVCVVALVTFTMAIRADAGAWGMLLLPAVVLWNPLLPITMTGAAWLPLDLILAAGLIGYGFWARARIAAERRIAS